MKKILKWMIAFLVAGMAVLITYRLFVAQRIDLPEGASAIPVAVVVASPARRDLAERVSLTGEIRPRNEVSVVAKLAGGVEQMPVKVGGSVRAGQLLAVIEHREIEWQNRQAQAQEGCRSRSGRGTDEPGERQRAT